MKSKEIIKMLEADGWFKQNQKGSHCQYKHPFKTGKVTVPHPRSDLPVRVPLEICDLFQDKAECLRAAQCTF